MKTLLRLFLVTVLVFTPSVSWAVNIPNNELDALWNQHSEEAKQNATELFKAFKALGYSTEMAAMLVGTARQESGWNRGSSHAVTQTCSFFQWIGGRKAAVLAFAGVSQCKDITPEKAAQFADKEFKEQTAMYLPAGGVNHLDYLSPAQAELKRANLDVKINTSDKFANYEEFKKSKNWAQALFIHMANVERCGVGETRFDNRVKYTALALYKLGNLSADSSPSEATPGKTEGKLPTSDYDAKDMPPKLEMEQGDDIQLGALSDLNSAEKRQVEDLREGIVSTQDHGTSYLRAGLIWLGIMILIWAILLLIAMCAEMILPGVSFVRILTLGWVKFSRETPRPSNTTGVGGILIIVIILGSLSVLLMSGTLLTLLAMLYS